MIIDCSTQCTAICIGTGIAERFLVVPILKKYGIYSLGEAGFALWTSFTKCITHFIYASLNFCGRSNYYRNMASLPPRF